MSTPRWMQGKPVEEKQKPRWMQGRAVASPAQPALPASPFLQRAAGMLPEGTQPVFPAGAQATPVTGKQAALDARNEQIRTRQDLTGKALKAVRDVQDIQRKRRVEPVTKAADIAAAQAEEKYRAETPFYDRTDRMMYRDAARQGVYNQADVVSPSDAFTGQTLNALAAGAPAIANKDVRQFLTQAESDQPLSSLGGQVVGFLGPGALVETGLRGLSRAAQPTISRLMPQGGSATERGTRVAGRTVGLAGSGATQSGIYQGTVGESLAAGREDRAPSLAGAVEGFKTGATDPIAILALPAALGANRLLTYIRSSGATATPASVGQEISQLTGGRVAALNAPQSAAAQVLDMGLAEAGIRSQAVDRVIRSFERAGMSREDITGLFQSVQQRLSGLPEAEAGRLTLGQALLEALENPELSRAAGSFPQAAMQLRQILRNASQGGPIGDVPRQGDQRAGIVSGVRRELQGSQTNFAQDAIDNALGNASLISINDLISGAKREIGSAYEEVLRAADPNRPEARGIAMIVMGDASSPGILKRRAENAGFESVEAYVAARPDEAGHWVRSALAKAGRSAKGREKIELDTTVAQLDELLETNAGYAEARRAYGTEMGVEDATEFGNRFIASSKNEYSVDLLMRELEGMSDRERAVALASIRNNLRSYLRGSQEEASAKISQLTNVGALNALERLGPEGVQVADTLRFLRREQGFLGNVMYGSDTARNLSAGKAEALGNTGLQNVTSGQGGVTPAMIADAAASTVLGGPTAIFTPMRVAGAGIKNLFAPRVATLNDEVRFLMGRRGNIPDLPQSGTADFSAPPPQGGTPPQAPRTVGAGPAAAGAPVSPAGAPVPAPPPTSSPLATEWQQVMPQIGAARQVASDLRDAAATARSPDQIADMQTQLMLLRQQLQEVVTARGAGQTAEDLRLQEIVDALSVGGQDPRYLSALADEVANDLNAITQALNLVRTVGVPPPPVRGAGFALGPDTTNALAGGTLGGIAPAETPEERARNVAVGAGLGYGGTRLGAMGRRTVGAEPAPANMPRTPRDAMRFETPGSPEYEAALAKGLDMSQAGRRQRGIDQGYDMDRVLYHGTIDDFEAFDPQKSEAKFGVHVGTSRAAGDRARAKGEMEAGRRNNWQKGGNADPLTNQQVIPIVAKFKKPLRLPDLGAWTPSSVANAIAKQYGIRPASNRPADVMNAIRKAGYDSIVYKNVSEGRGSDSYIIFDPAEIRSVNAVFDPDNAASPVLTAGSGGYFNRQSMRLPGVGPTAREAELAETWRETRPIVQTARTAASSGEQAADIAVQSRAPGDIARAKDAKAALIREIETAQALRAGMDTPEDARLADALEALKENTSDPLLISSQIGAAKTSLERLLTDLGRPTMPSTMMRAPQRPPLRRTFSAEEEARLAPETPEPPSRTRYAEGEVPPIKGMGFGASEPPKPVRDARAAGYEGTDRGESAEWLSAVRKGLPMDTESRLARAREMGFDTETVLYHGTNKDFDEFVPGGSSGTYGAGIYVTESKRTVASNYARGEGARILPLFIKKGKYASEELWDRAVERAQVKLDKTDPDAPWSQWHEMATAELKKRGFLGVIGDNEIVIFDPVNIRSVNAAFDPDKATSSTLLAAAPFAAVGGAGLTLAGEDARNQRTVGKPKASQSARTVGKAKTN